MRNGRIKKSHYHVVNQTTGATTVVSYYTNGKASSAAPALAVKSFLQSRECRRLWNRHDRLECQWGAMGVISIRDSSDGMTKDLDRRLGNLFVVIHRTHLAKTLEHPAFTRLHVRLRVDAS